MQTFTTQDLLGHLNDAERKHAPERLYVAGDDQLLRQGPRVAVIGSRRANSSAIRRASKLTRALVKQDVTVVSGLAAGIDTVAHQSAMEAGGRPVAVLGTPLDTVYPRSNRDLQAAIVRQHAVVSEFPLGAKVRPKNFPMWNRTMALLSDATVIVATAETSGTKYEVREALRLERELLVLESLATSPLSWIQALLHHGAQILSDSNLDRWLETLRGRSSESDSN